MAVLFFIYLFFGQLVLGVVGVGIAFLLSLLPLAGRLLRRMIHAIFFALVGAYLGVVSAYLFIVVSGFLGGKIFVWLAALTPWILLTGYVAGLVFGGGFGWRRMKIRISAPGGSGSHPRHAGSG